MTSVSRSNSSRPARIVFLIDKLHRAGAQRNLSQVARGLDRGRFHPQVVCLSRKGGMAEELEATGVEVQALGVERLYEPRAAFALRKLVRALRAEPSALVHTYLPSANCFGGIAARLSGRILVTTRRDLGFSRSRRLAALETRLVNPYASRVVVPSQAVAKVACDEPGITRDKTVVIPNAVDTDFFRSAGRGDDERARLGLGGDSPVVGVVANFLAIKGHADFLEAASRIASARADVRFVLTGDGELRDMLRARVRALGLAEKVLFTGSVSDTRGLLELFDVLVLPSHSEGMSNVLLEAMAMGRPIDATDVGGNPELIVHEACGLLVPPRDPRALEAAVLRLLDARDRADALGREARRRAETEFSLGTMLDAYQALYDTLLGYS